MTNINNAKKYCSEDISLIENYNQAISDQTRMWEIHHRRECDDEGKNLFTHKQLKEMNLYYNRPASELIFVTRSMHWKIHKEIRSKCGKIAIKKMTFEQRSKGGKIGGKSGGKIGGKKTGPINGKKRSIPILQFSKDGTFIKEWPSAYESQRQLGIAQSSICYCCKGRLKSAGGFVWRYKS